MAEKKTDARKQAEAEGTTIRSSQYLLFRLGHEDYAFDVVRTKEVLSDVLITPLPTKTAFLKGVINLRGSIIPVIDLGMKFGLPAREAEGGSSVVVLEVGGQGQQAIVGALVDEVRGVFRFEDAELEPAPKFGMRLDSRLVKAIAKRRELFVTVLDSELIFSEAELWGQAAARPASGASLS